METKKTQLNKEQTEAVNFGEGPLLIVAGAGTGKTSVISERIVNLINSGKANSEEILALTFTEKAAGEMEERVDRLLPYGAFFDLSISTFHSFCQDVLTADGLDIGLPTDYKLLNEYEQYALFKKHLDRFGLDYYRPMGNPTKFIRDLLKHFSRCKDEDITPLEYLEYAEELRQNLDGMLSGGVGKKKAKKTTTPNPSLKSRGTEAEKSPLLSKEGQGVVLADFLNAKGEFDGEIAELEVKKIEEVANAYHIYQNLLLENNALDFGDLINYCLKLFRERPNILAHYQSRFKYILVDEFQDTNWAQYELVKLLAAPQNNITVVGDDDQSVYRFRGAAMANILEFKKDYLDAKQVFLVENYRNRQNILDLSYDFIKLNNPNRLEEQLKKECAVENPPRPCGAATPPKRGISLCRPEAVEGNCLSKQLKANIADAGEIEVIRGADSSDELVRVVKKIAEIKEKDKDANWGDFAILARSNDAGKEICAYLEEAGMPYKLFSSRGLYGVPPIINSISYLTAVADQYDGVALYKTLTLPVFNFSSEELAAMNYIVYRKAVSLYKVLHEAAALGLGDKTLEKINKFLAIFKKHAADARHKPASEIFSDFLEDSGYLKFLYGQPEREAILATNQLNQFMKRIKSFETASVDKSIREFLAELSVEIEAGEQGTLPASDEEDPAMIKIMTVHAAKGLEFKYVFVINLIDKRFPSIERGESIKIPNALLDEKIPVGEHHLEEERRLFYVAVTRAKKGIYFSWSSDAGGKRERRASRFLVESKLVEDLDISNKDDKKIEPLEDKNSMLSGKKLSAARLAQRSSAAERSWVPKAPERFSYSQFEAYERCPYQYRFDNILHVPKRGNFQMSFGKTMHSTLQKILQIVKQAGEKKQDSLFSDAPLLSKEGFGGGSAGVGEKEILTTPTPLLDRRGSISLEECLKIYEESWIDEWYETEANKQKYHEKGKEIVKAFYEEHKNNWPNVLFLEKDFSLRLKVDGEGITIKGKIDRIDEMPDGKLKIVDYKTGKPKEKLEFNEKAQLLIYQQAVKEVFRQEVGALCYRYLNDNSEIEFLGAEKDFAKLDEKISATIRAIRVGEFPATPGQQCKFCDYSGICEFKKI
jgi:DNA helicase II / ATP-dependent DNA helicase PcrA